MNEFCRCNPRGDYVQTYEVPNDFNQTFGTKDPWDHHILDEDIPRLMSLLLPVKPDGNFAQTEGNAVDAPFSAPYGLEARKMGYGRVIDVQHREN
jgi:hypothetical protein